MSRGQVSTDSILYGHVVPRMQRLLSEAERIRQARKFPLRIEEINNSDHHRDKIMEHGLDEQFLQILAIGTEFSYDPAIAFYRRYLEAIYPTGTDLVLLQHNRAIKGVVEYYDDQPKIFTSWEDPAERVINIIDPGRDSFYFDL